MLEVKSKYVHCMDVTIDGSKYRCERIGKGRFSEAFLVMDYGISGYVTNGEVFVKTHEDDYAKEMLSNLLDDNNEPIPHLPKIEHIGDETVGNVTYNWYKMPRYHKLTAQDKSAWADYKALKSYHDDAMKYERTVRGYTSVNLRPKEFQAYIVNQHFCDLVSGDAKLAPTYERAVYALKEWCATYGSSWLIEEPNKRNCMVDNNGELVWVDPVLDVEKLQRKKKVSVSVSVYAGERNL